ncbi:hypothetical protein V5O48_004712 [Marasmius crinis-equi]|uniref:Uncharacterized protein n=1 Tax=Marasmius crinis-equi TaxID=585013 RepID=A0ABR3FPQ6_9AGAR
MLNQLMHRSQACSSSKLTLGETTQPQLSYDSIPESDIADHYYDSMLAHGEEETQSFDVPDTPPPRPDSRLDFNIKEEDEVEEPSLTILGPKPLRFEWTKSLFQKIGIHRSSMEKSITTSSPPHDVEPLPSSPRTSRVHTSSRSSSHFPPPQTPPEHDILIDDLSFTFCSSDEDDETSDEESEIDVECLSLSDFDLQESDGQVPSSPVAEMTIGTTPSSSTSSTSPLPAVDLDDTSMSSSLPDEPHLIKPKFCYHPSRFSPTFSSKPRSRVASPQPQRHNYEYRGHSRHALLHLKWFWASREEEWAEYENATRAYGGISTSPELPPSSYASRFPGLFASARTTRPNSKRHAGIPNSPVPSHPVPPMTMHPRWGDLSGLRDPWCAHMDRYFVEVPMWRIKKSLWTADLQVMSMVHQRRQEDREEPPSSPADDDEDAESLMRMSMLTGLSDDSDLTLVESECEGDSAEDQSTNADGSGSAAGKEKEKALYPDDEAEHDEYFEDVDLDGPSTSYSASTSSSSCRYSLSSSKSSLNLLSYSQPSVFSSQPMFTLHPPYAPFCPSSLSSRNLEHVWATNWYQRSQLLLQLLTVAEPEQPEAPLSGLGIDIDREEKPQRRSYTDEDAYLPSSHENPTHPRSRTVSA